MDTLFPFGFSSATSFYLSLYIGTLVLHVLFMNYVLAGVIVVALDTVIRSKRLQPISEILTDWLPSMLSGAITAGIAPLLFVQILYQENFYTANLLLNHRWMAILPVLIVGSYGLYLQKSKWAKRQSRTVKLLISLFPVATVLFTAYSWTENHLLALKSTSEWAAFYSSDQLFHFEPALLPRLLMWTFGAFPTLAMIVGWQLWYREVRSSTMLVVFAWIGIAGALTSALLLDRVRGGATGEAFRSPMAFPYFVGACAGIVLQAASWLVALRRGLIEAKQLVAATLGSVATILGISICRECLRLQVLGPSRVAELAEHHALAYAKEGFWLFAFFLFAVVAAIIFIFGLVRGVKSPQ